MSALRILKFPERFLKTRAAKVEKVGEDERKALAKMAETMYVNSGIGLAATQVGIDKQLAVIDIGKGPVMMANPVIIKKEGQEAGEEGCLSVPNVIVKVRRAKRLVVNYVDEKGEVSELKADGLLARAIQHEIDHLSGRLIIDYLPPIKKVFVKGRLSIRRARNSEK